MPQKSKRKKLLTEYRRKIQSLPNTTPPASQTDDESHAQSGSLVRYTIPVNGSTKNQNLPIQTTPEMDTEFAAVRKDLLHTIVLVGIMFAAELTIWRIFG